MDRVGLAVFGHPAAKHVFGIFASYRYRLPAIAINGTSLGEPERALTAFLKKGGVYFTERNGT